MRDSVTWKAKHFGLYQRLTVEIERCDFPDHFENRMTKGAFKSFTHKHYFENHYSQTLMKDGFKFELHSAYWLGF